MGGMKTDLFLSVSGMTHPHMALNYRVHPRKRPQDCRICVQPRISVRAHWRHRNKFVYLSHVATWKSLLSSLLDVDPETLIRARS